MEQLEIPAEVRSYLEGLLKDSGMAVDDDMKEEMIKELFARLDKHMTATIVDNMPQEHIEEFIRMTEEKKPREEIEKYIVEKIPNAKEVLSQSFVEFRDLYLGNVAVARNAPQK